MIDLKTLNNDPQLTSITIGKILKKVRKAKKITGTELGEKINISQQQISSYERGVNNISLKLFFTILSELGITVNDFILLLNKEFKLDEDINYYHHSTSNSNVKANCFFSKNS
ncbi:helix-turn-helix domain-containing protein [Proteus myxofaciens]|uniref:HTH cro/C1-type domain-containing protein n=1 Tax=Proteus myxofaciens ATCC 19692 TaxID=1354337 RepID=A0A198EZY5_9GAMM|nr:helix-turn-helix transcriptional regulator [Proteus myxofaciens]OAT18065.1 hypothetical protein M983_3250 [Proteus myxofaciens ATCC 19692]